MEDEMPLNPNHINKNLKRPKFEFDSVVNMTITLRNDDGSTEDITLKNCVGYNFELENFVIIRLKGRWSGEHKKSDYVRDMKLIPISKVVNVEMEDRMVFHTDHGRLEFIKGLLRGDIKD